MKILTALNNNELYRNLKEKFKNKKEYKIFDKDIIYKEGIIEFLKNNSDINLLILNINIDGNINIYDLIKNILEINKYIEIIVILKKDDVEIRRFLSSYNINKILIENEFSFEELIKLITNDNTIKQKNIEKEIEELRNIIFQKKENTFKSKLKRKINNIKFKKQKRKEVKEKSKNNKKNENRNTKDKKDELNNKVYFTLSENIQKYNISSIDITIKIKK